MSTNTASATTHPMRGTVPLARVAGVPVAAHWSVLGIVALLAVGMATVELPLRSGGHSTAAYVVAGLVAAVAVVLSLVAHEAAHAIVARRLGLRVEGVTLWILGGATRLRGEPDRPGVELRMAVAGPLTSGLLAAGFLGAADLLPSGLVAAVLVELAWINLVLAVFNLLPAAPLDGGRVLHAVLWARRGDRWRAEAVSARAGRALAAVMVVGGLWITLAVGFEGIWFVLVGWWIGLVATEEARRARVGRALGCVTVGQVARSDLRGPLTPSPLQTPVHAQDPLLDVIGVLARPGARLVVLDPEGHPVGTVTAADVRPLVEGTASARGRPTGPPPPQGPPPDDWWWPGGGGVLRSPGRPGAPTERER